ncbi:hypothetical protein BCR42DRAFT_242441 [Absidia repens]|uniref:Dipeptidylpeptidase IV N-terminal domain-containing protein n=1 Tax=Absidia repens TaxID=90262 RepID=A0A1X2IK31_9FUNG|nr:hypothetical protein BCR42DRAFT_242441 [Absidia repens]
MNHTNSIPLQSIQHSQTIDEYVDQYMAVVDSRHSIQSFSSTTTSSSTNHRHSQDSQLSDEDDRLNNNMMRKTYYDHTQQEDEDDQSYLHHKGEQSEEQERLVSSMDDDLDELDDPLADRNSPKGDRKWLCFLFLGILLVGWLIWTIIVNSMSPGQPRNVFHDNGNHIDLTDIMKSEFIPKRPNVVWMDSGHTDGLFTYIDPENHNVMMRSVENGTKQVLLDSVDLLSGHDVPSIKHYSFSKDTQYMLLWTNETKVSLNPGRRIIDINFFLRV